MVDTMSFASAPDAIEDLLAAARSFCRLSENETKRPSGTLERAAYYAAIAQAHANTARAMMLDDLRKSGDPRY
jgi:DNA-binding GntR family transcriptional regulator